MCYMSMVVVIFVFGVFVFWLCGDCFKMSNIGNKNKWFFILGKI